MAQYAILIYAHDSAHAPEATPQGRSYIKPSAS